MAKIRTANGWTAGAPTLSSLHAALLGVKVWSGSAYVWSGDGTAPDPNSYTNIVFIDPTGTHDPKTATGGRNNANDLWETGEVGSPGIITCTSTTRPASPTAGTAIYETDTFKFLIWLPGGSGWRPPYSVPWGAVGSAYLGSNQSVTTTTTVLSFTGATWPGRWYDMVADLQLQKDATAGSVTVTIYSTEALQTLNRRQVSLGANEFGSVYFAARTNGSNGSSAVVQVSSSAGAVTVVGGGATTRSQAQTIDLGP